MSPESAAYLADLAQIAGDITVVSAVLFGAFELSGYRKQRRDAVAAELMRTFYSPALANVICVVQSFPGGATVDDFRRKGDEPERAAVLISMTFETMGLLVFERIAPIDLVEKLAGGAIVAMWRRLRPWLAAIQQEQAQPSWAEWFEWLAGQCDKRKRAQEPAYLKYRDWQPWRSRVRRRHGIRPDGVGQSPAGARPRSRALMGPPSPRTPRPIRSQPTMSRRSTCHPAR